ncbi:hypothetical protein GWI33_008312 [Rhynchophorus ferrugineus]|uniref:C2H2-type domain-containing protein n=1 Tax=Rhynchophorus ferrugineus TaxID=354439 RepID=A0A834IT29_RHYFE|nr:hypothetical protein GWI33_008312 [Rhynchophorus ferrugineus]
MASTQFEEYYRHLCQSTMKDHMFGCAVCNYKHGWRTIIEFNDHVESVCGVDKLNVAERKIKSDRPRYFCEKCRKPFWIYSSLLKHHGHVHMDDQIRCSYCPYADVSLNSMLWHYTKHMLDSKTLMPCLECSCIFFGKSVYSKHCEIVHRRQIALRCLLCPQKSFTKAGQLYRHIFKFHNSLSLEQNTVPMDKSNNVSSNSAKIYNVPNISTVTGPVTHRFSNNSKFTNEIYCDVCNDRFCDFKRYYNHRRLIHPTHRYNCGNCLKAYVDVRSLIDHYRAKHPNVCTSSKIGPSFYCNLCGKDFNNVMRRLDHIKVHHPVDFLKCSLCVRSFTTAEDLVEHININHSSKNSDLFDCPSCHKIFFFAEVFITHLNTQHVHLFPKKKFKWRCNICRQAFPDDLSFRDHMMTYVNSTYHCFVCPNVSSSTVDLRNHLEREHDANTFRMYTPFLLFDKVDSSTIQHNVIPSTEQYQWNIKDTEPAIQCSSTGMGSQAPNLIEPNVLLGGGQTNEPPKIKPVNTISFQSTNKPILDQANKVQQHKESIVDDEMMNLLSSIETEDFDTILIESEERCYSDDKTFTQGTLNTGTNSTQRSTCGKNRNAPSSFSFTSITFDEEILKHCQPIKRVEQSKAVCVQSNEFTRYEETSSRNVDNPDTYIVDVACDVCGECISGGKINQHYCPGPF